MDRQTAMAERGMSVHQWRTRVVCSRLDSEKQRILIREACWQQHIKHDMPCRLASQQHRIA